MPPALDLIGRRFGRLTVLRRAGTIKYGTVQPAWACRCDCGRTEIFATNQLTQRGYVECAECRRPNCVVCGRKVPLERGRKNTCCGECQRTKNRTTQLEHYYRRIQEDPDLNRRNHAKRAERRVADPVLAEAHAAREHARSVARWAEVKSDPALLQIQREKRAEWYAEHATKVQERRRQRIANMDIDEFERWAERSRSYQHAYARRWRDELQSNPAAHRKFLDAQRIYMREWKRRRAIVKLASISEELVKRKS